MTTKLPVTRLPSRLTRLPNMGSHTVECFDGLRLLLIDDLPVRFTPTEYRIVQQLLSTPRALVDDSVLTKAAFQGLPLDQQQNLDRHIDEIRKKLRYSGLTVLRVVQRGWLIVEAEENSTEPPAS